jgi:2-polyprenyl-6-methoxyphenol hydroxylase-like FAD-dependent oxidoreductase
MSQPNPSPEHHSGAEHHNVVIVGGGTGGITVAARLRRAGVHDVTVVEPATSHYYQPLFTPSPRYDMWLLKRHGLAALYWNLMIKGRA